MDSWFKFVVFSQSLEDQSRALSLIEMFCLLKGSDKHPEDADRLREEYYTVKAKLEEVWLELEKKGEGVIWDKTRIRENWGGPGGEKLGWEVEEKIITCCVSL